MVSNEPVKITDGAYCLPEEKLVNWGASYHDFGKIPSAFGLPIDIAFITSDNACVTHYEILTSAVDAGDGSGEGCLSDHYGIYMKFVPGRKCETIRPVPEGEPAGTKDLKAAYGSAEVDGKKDSAYDNSTAARVNVGVSGSAVADAQAHGTVSTVYDDKYLYCFAEVADTTPCDKVALNEVQDDVSEGVCFFFDYLNTPETDERYPVDGEQGGLRVGFASLTDETIEPKEREAGMPHAYAAVKTDKGYNIELRVGLSESLRERIWKGNDVSIGIGFQINDDINNDGVRDMVCFSSPGINYEWKSEEPESGGCKGFQDILLAFW